MNGFFNNLADLELLTRKNPLILAIQETHRTSIDTMNKCLQGQYTWLSKSGNNVYQSVALGIHTTIPFTPIALDSTLLATAARIEAPFPLSVVSIYLQCGDLPNLDARLRNLLDQIDEPRLILGDLNSHHPLWGSGTPDSKGNICAGIVEDYDLVVLNDGTPTFTRGQTNTAIDVSLASREITKRLSWTCLEDPMGSDHRPVRIRSNCKPPETSRRPRWIYDQADWAAFEIAIDASLDINTPSNIDELTTTIFDAAKGTIPRTSTTPGRKALHWWSPETRAATKARRKAMRAVKRLSSDHPDKESAIARYRSMRNECRQIIKEAKRKSWEDFIDGINNNQSSVELWNRVNSLSGKRRIQGIAIRHENGISRDGRSPTVVADKLAEYFASLSAICSYNHVFIRRNNASSTSLDTVPIPQDTSSLPINQPFSMLELSFALASSKGKSAGPDEIGYPLLKHLPPRGKQVLLTLLNHNWSQDLFPKQWGHSLVIPIPKNRSSSTDPKDYRPISLTNCTCKVLERMVNRRITDYLQDNNLLDHRQHAFRKGFGTGTYFASLGQVLDDAFQSGQHVDIAALDLSKAYNRTWTPFVVRQLSEWGLSGHLLHFVQNFLKNRTFQVGIGNHKSKVNREETGVPQGSVLAVTLFIVAMNGVFGALPKDIYIFVYADDIVLVVVGRKPVALRRKLQAAVTAVNKWAKSVGFELSASKSVFTHICNSRHRPELNPVHIESTAVPYKTKTKPYSRRPSGPPPQFPKTFLHGQARLSIKTTPTTPDNKSC